jgi:hypothetical protein
VLTSADALRGQDCVVNVAVAPAVAQAVQAVAGEDALNAAVKDGAGGALHGRHARAQPLLHQDVRQRVVGRRGGEEGECEAEAEFFIARYSVVLCQCLHASHTAGGIVHACMLEHRLCPTSMSSQHSGLLPGMLPGMLPGLLPGLLPVPDQYASQHSGMLPGLLPGMLPEYSTVHTCPISLSMALLRRTT